ncbi:energy transducer TonB [Erythrobacter sp. BLCC-B19]|uniref:energy transducer TonB n=1 Tax=Erythrobacter sp. BLCC-B19 TaxID=3025315 RepID=UPI002361DEB3|nr:energy transducer TonB [Erythrobacter sp. BLCC-B19]WDA42056.1 TonB family protein [Erythrobacter sp. BLCC-B19]
MSYASQAQAGNKTTSIVMVALIHIAVGYLLVTGLAIDAVKQIAERVTTVEVKEEEPPPPDEPPPPPEDTPEPTSPPPPNAPPMPFDLPTNNQAETTRDPTPVAPVDPRPSTPQPAPVGPPTQPKPPSKARGVKTKGERGWAARIQEDYPRRAAQEEIEGTVGVRVTVTAEGRATNCSVSSSSGSDILDSAACKAVERYARFEPALNDAGEPISASWSTRITYKLN